MDYNLSREATWKPSPTIGELHFGGTINNEFGSIPLPNVIAKFEETPMEEEELQYHEYARHAAMDNGPDKTFLADETPRGRNDQSKGFLNLLHGGHRGSAEPPRHPEQFLGFGPEDRDPRGVATEPNMSLITQQADARARFIRFSKDAQDNTTSGGRSETKAIHDNMQVRGLTKSRFRQFSRQLDGRREGLHRGWDNQVAVVINQLDQAAYGDAIRDWALAPQRRAVVIADKILHDTRMFGEDANDADWAYHSYSKANRRQAYKSTLRAIDATTTDVHFADADKSKCYKAAAVLVKAIATLQTKTDADFGNVHGSQARRVANAQRDLMLILKHVDGEAKFAASDLTRVMKSAHPDVQDHIARLVQSDADTPAHMLLNAELIRKTAHGCDKMQRLTAIAQDTVRSQVEAVGAINKHGPMAVAATSRDGKGMTAFTDAKATKAYRGARRRWVRNLGGVSEDSFSVEDRTRLGKSTAIKEDTQRKDLVTAPDWGENYTPERHGGRLGSKRLRGDYSGETDLNTSTMADA